MRAQRLAIVLTVINLTLLVGLVAERRTTRSGRGSQAGGAGYCTDAAGAGTGDCRRTEPRAGTACGDAAVDGGRKSVSGDSAVAIDRSEERTGGENLGDARWRGSLFSDEADHGVLIQARGEGNFVKVTSKEGREAVLKP